MLWRVRTSLTDRPGSLAQLAATCGEHAAERMILGPEDRGEILAELTNTDSEGWSFSENARISALLDVVRLAGALDLPQAETGSIGYEVLADAVIARTGDTVIATASLTEDGSTTVVVSPPWRRKGVGRAVFVLMAGVARHAGRDEIALMAPGDDEGTLGMLNALGLRGLVKLKDGVLEIRVSLADIRPVGPRSKLTARSGPASFPAQ